MIKKFEEFTNISQIDFVNENSYASFRNDEDYTIENGPYILRLEFYPLSTISLGISTHTSNRGIRKTHRTSEFAFEDNRNVRILLESVDVVIKKANESEKSVITGIDIDDKDKSYVPYLPYNAIYVYPFSDIEEINNFMKTIPNKVKSGYIGLGEVDILSTTTKKLNFKFGLPPNGKDDECLKYLMDMFKKNEGRTGLIG